MAGESGTCMDGHLWSLGVWPLIQRRGWCYRGGTWPALWFRAQGYKGSRKKPLASTRGPSVITDVLDELGARLHTSLKLFSHLLSGLTVDSDHMAIVITT